MKIKKWWVSQFQNSIKLVFYDLSKSYGKWYESFEEAHAALIEREEYVITQRKNQLEKAIKGLAKVRKMVKPKE